jgi:hypothetical protein
MVTITRNIEIKKLKAAKGWKLVYGRRKTGKSFLIENFTKWNNYFFVKRGGEIFDKTKKKNLTYTSFIILLEELLKTNKKIVIDEFHRLPKDFLDFLHIHSGQGEITLISSTLWLSKRLQEKDSPILGLFHEILVNPIDERDILRELVSYGKPEEVIVLGVYLREPLMLRYLETKSKDILTDYFEGTRFLVPLLVTSVFQEEDKEFSQIYEGVVRAIAGGNVNSKNITNFLFSRRLIPREEHGYSQQYLANLIKLGLVKKFKIFDSRKFVYANASPMIDAYFYLDEKYNFSEEEMTRKQIKEVLEKVTPFYVEDFIGSFLAKCWGLRRNKILSPNLEIDLVLCKFKKLEIVGEIKWRKKLFNKDIRKIEEKLERFDCRKILVVPEKNVLERKPEGIEVITAGDLVKMAQAQFKK